MATSKELLELVFDIQCPHLLTWKKKTFSTYSFFVIVEAFASSFTDQVKNNR